VSGLKELENYKKKGKKGGVLACVIPTPCNTLKKGGKYKVKEKSGRSSQGILQITRGKKVGGNSQKKDPGKGALK